MIEDADCKRVMKQLLKGLPFPAVLLDENHRVIDANHRASYLLCSLVPELCDSVVPLTSGSLCRLHDALSHSSKPSPIVLLFNLAYCFQSFLVHAWKNSFGIWLRLLPYKSVHGPALATEQNLWFHKSLPKNTRPSPYSSAWPNPESLSPRIPLNLGRLSATDTWCESHDALIWNMENDTVALSSKLYRRSTNNACMNHFEQLPEGAHKVH